eukprot:1143069-Pelagomonas_calceolata.AAC.2
MDLNAQIIRCAAAGQRAHSACHRSQAVYHPGRSDFCCQLPIVWMCQYFLALHLPALGTLMKRVFVMCPTTRRLLVRGRVVEVGTHAQLSATSKHYDELMKAQELMLATG